MERDTVQYMQNSSEISLPVAEIQNQSNTVVSISNCAKMNFIFRIWHIINPFPNKPCFLHVCSTSLENTVGKGEIACDGQLLLFPQCFQPFWRVFCHFYQI